MARKSNTGTASSVPDFMDMLSGAQSAAPKASSGAKADKTIWFDFGVKKAARLRVMSALDWAITTLTATLQTYETQAKADAMSDYFIPKGVAARAQPENFKSKVAEHVVGFQLRKRSAASALSEDEREILTRFNIPTKEKVTVEAGLKINPAHLNADVLKALADVVKANLDVLPVDLIVQQPKQSTIVTADDAIVHAFKTLPANSLEIVLPIISTSAVSYKTAALESEDFDRIEEILFPEEEEEAK